MMRTSNPALNGKVFTAIPYYGGKSMTVQGTVNRTAALLVIAVVAAAFTWSRAKAPEAVMPWLLGGFIGGFAVAMITVFKKDWAPVTAPLYAALEGLALGAVSAVFEARFPGIVLMAVMLTFGTLAAMLIAYTSRLIRATENFKLGVVAATGGIAIFYIAGMLAGLFGVSVPLLHSSGPFGIGFSVFVVVIAAMNLVLDFDFIENGVAAGAPKYMEWYGAFGLMVTLVWLYLEILRLLAKLQSRR